MAARRILGVDPGTRITGWGVVDHQGNGSRLVACGAVRTKSKDMPGRLREIHEALAAVAREHRPDALAVEKQYFGEDANAALVVGMARGMALLVAGECGLSVREYPPATVKKAVTGNGAATKARVATMVRVLLGLREAPEPEDITDALAVALADAHRGPSGPSQVLPDEAGQGAVD